MSNKRTFFLHLPFLICLTVVSSSSFAQLIYPVARTETFDTLIYGKKISDEYFWMSRKEHEKEMLDFSKQQGKLTQTILDSLPGTEILLREWDEAYATLQDEIWSLKTTGNAIYYQRDVPGEGTWLCRRASVNDPEEKMLGRVNIHGQKYAVRRRSYAHHKPLVAFMLTQNGEANPHIRIFDLDKKEFLPDSIGPVMFNDSRGVSMTWLPDDKGLLYTQAPPATESSEKYYNGKIILHITGTDPKTDEPIFGINIIERNRLKTYETHYV